MQSEKIEKLWTIPDENASSVKHSFTWGPLLTSTRTVIGNEIENLLISGSLV